DHAHGYGAPRVQRKTRAKHGRRDADREIVRIPSGTRAEHQCPPLVRTGSDRRLLPRVRANNPWLTQITRLSRQCLAPPAVATASPSAASPKVVSYISQRTQVQ